jgi:UTP-glucose-1-phosphate uridylyltransferase|tara:strand:+ start:1024 stop:1305 length:282 start_codon:yes stop_codon:yes gene_type:complete
MIKIIQLITAEMIIADYNETTHEIENPLFIHQQAQEGAGPKVNLYPYNILGEGNIILNPDNIVWTVEPEQKLKNQYENAFSSIITPPSPKLVT